MESGPYIVAIVDFPRFPMDFPWISHGFPWIPGISRPGRWPSQRSSQPSGGTRRPRWSGHQRRRWCLGTVQRYGYGSIPINTIFSGMNIHLPAILMWTEGVQGFDTLPYKIDIIYLNGVYNCMYVCIYIYIIRTWEITRTQVLDSADGSGLGLGKSFQNDSKHGNHQTNMVCFYWLLVWSLRFVDLAMVLNMPDMLLYSWNVAMGWLVPMAGSCSESGGIHQCHNLLLPWAFVAMCLQVGSWRASWNQM